MAVVGMVSRSKVLLMVDLNRVFSLANLIGTGKCHEVIISSRFSFNSRSREVSYIHGLFKNGTSSKMRLQCRHASGVQDTPLAPPPEAAATSTSSYTTSVRSTTTVSSSPSSNTSPSSSEVLVQFRQGLPQVTVPLPSRREYCRFTLRPVSNTVGDFINMMQQEDRGIDRIAVLTEHGVRIASSNTIESLFQEDFKLVINDREFGVKIPKLEKKKLNKDDIERLSDVRSLVSHLYEALNVQEHQIKKERELMAQLEELKTTIQPLEKKRQALEVVAVRRTTVLTWAGLGLMSVQFGILARLTWWEYSWDIMEPVTYFVTYGTAMAAYAYFVLTKQEYLLPDVRDREHLLTLHKRARKVGLDVNKYNEYKNEIARIESDLARLRDPLELHVPQARSSLHTRQNSLNQNTSALGKIRTMIEKQYSPACIKANTLRYKAPIKS